MYVNLEFKSPRLFSRLFQVLKSLAMQETPVWSLGWEDPLEKEMATHSRILARRIHMHRGTWGLQSMGSQRVGHDWAATLNLVFSGSIRMFFWLFAPPPALPFQMLVPSPEVWQWPPLLTPGEKSFSRCLWSVCYLSGLHQGWETVQNSHSNPCGKADLFMYKVCNFGKAWGQWAMWPVESTDLGVGISVIAGLLVSFSRLL